jgi:hypothetical protein
VLQPRLALPKLVKFASFEHPFAMYLRGWPIVTQSASSVVMAAKPKPRLMPALQSRLVLQQPFALQPQRRVPGSAKSRLVKFGCVRSKSVL